MNQTFTPTHPNRLMTDDTKLHQWNAAQKAKALAETDPNGLSAGDLGAKLDSGKSRSWLMLAGFSSALAEVSHVTTVGAQKYTPDGWMTVPNGSDRYMDAFARHMLLLGGGTDTDADTGCLHKAQMIWNLLASLELDLRGGL